VRSGQSPGFQQSYDVSDHFKWNISVVPEQCQYFYSLHSDQCDLCGLKEATWSTLACWIRHCFEGSSCAPKYAICEPKITRKFLEREHILPISDSSHSAKRACLSIPSPMVIGLFAVLSSRPIYVVINTQLSAVLVNSLFLVFSCLVCTKIRENYLKAGEHCERKRGKMTILCVYLLSWIS